MGPPELPGGNTLKSISAETDSSSLQWGRRNYPAETLGALVGHPGEVWRFNGAAGITRRKLAHRQGKRRRGDQASMGPPELPGGNMQETKPTRTRDGELQWGRRNYPAETSPVPLDVGPLKVMLQWGRRNYPAETIVILESNSRRQYGFNGAAGITRRKQARAAQYFAADPAGFNGAAGITRRKLIRYSSSVMSKLALQWGRRNYPAETLIESRKTLTPGGSFNGAAGITRRKQQPCPLASSRCLAGASMGPPELPGGNRYAFSMFMSRPLSLQWGRRNYPAETEPEAPE